ncbi:hypothetical protein BT67DRAFT_465288 [Trichocladium antarcticum]|uniref:Secreted protein n=1 Tax=Trichocladium antarcticum TaxID=1450529 RepID=A0AAN6ZA95_9PEZI|nr:hypothetical protein BT67DRAFT_465288 [Trichocladium antarcticum]
MRASIALVLVAWMGKSVLGDDSDSGIPGYGTQVMQWEVEVTPGHTELLNGTIQEAYEQAHQINPDFTPPGSGKDTAEGTVIRGLHEKRGHVTCGGFKTGVVVPTLDGVRYLRRITGKPHNQPGPRYCTRVSCSWKSAIWWCNDNQGPLYLDSWNQIADSAYEILVECADGTDVSGQNFERGNWNIIVRRDSC